MCEPERLGDTEKFRELAAAKTILTEVDRDKVWRAANVAWMHYVFENDQWWTYPLDPRTSPGCMNKHRAFGQYDGKLTRKAGFVEVP